MAKKTHVKVRLVPEANPDSPFFYYVKKPAGGEKAKVKLKAKKYNPATRKHEVFVEKKTGSSKLTKLGKKELLVNNVLVLEINERGILVHKEFYNKEDMKKINFDNNQTSVAYSKKSFIYNFMSSLRQKINDPLGKKRIKD